MARKRKGDISNVVDPDGNFLENAESELVPMEIVDDFPLASPETDELREKIKGLTQSISRCYYDLSALVYKVNKEKLYKTWGYNEFAEWADQELGFQKRKAYYLVQFQNYCEQDLKQILPEKEYKDTLEQLKEVGWTKALEIAKSKCLTKENAQQLLEEAKDDQIDSLCDKIALIKDGNKSEGADGVTENTMKKVPLRFKLTTAQEELWLNAFEKAKMAIAKDDVGPEFAFEFIVGDFLAGVANSLEGSLSQIERVHGVSVVGFSDTDKKVIYGADTLKAIAQAVS